MRRLFENGNCSAATLSGALPCRCRRQLLGADETRNQFPDCNSCVRRFLPGLAITTSWLPVPAADSHSLRHPADIKRRGCAKSVYRASLRCSDAEDSKTAPRGRQTGAFVGSLVRDSAVVRRQHLPGGSGECTSEPACCP